MYYPLLKLANNEMRALKELKSSSLKKIIPIIESKRIKVSNQAKWESTFNTLGTYLKERISNTTFIYDFHTAIEDLQSKNILISQQNTNLVEYCIDKLDACSLNVIPCFNHDSPDWIINSIIDSNYQEFAIRIRCGEFPETFDQIIVSKLQQDIKKMTNKKQITIILDFFNKKVDINRIINAINSFSLLNPTNIVYLATACPENANKSSKNSITPMGKRQELSNYFTLKNTYSDLNFGDYTVRLKGEILNGFNHNNSYIKIFYSSLSDYYIAKSELIKDNGEFTFHKVCQNLVKSSIFTGENFSSGDKLIKQCADKKMTIGDHQTPIAIGINHHIELTITQV